MPQDDFSEGSGGISLLTVGSALEALLTAILLILVAFVVYSSLNEMINKKGYISRERWGLILRTVVFLFVAFFLLT